MLEIQADHSTLPRLSSLVTRVGTRSEREQLLASTTGLVCVTVSIGAPPGAIKTAYDVILQTAPIVVHGGTPRRGMPLHRLLRQPHGRRAQITLGRREQFTRISDEPTTTPSALALEAL